MNNKFCVILERRMKNNMPVITKYNVSEEVYEEVYRIVTSFHFRDNGERK